MQRAENLCFIAFVFLVGILVSSLIFSFMLNNSHTDLFIVILCWLTGGFVAGICFQKKIDTEVITLALIFSAISLPAILSGEFMMKIILAVGSLTLGFSLGSPEGIIQAWKKIEGLISTIYAILYFIAAIALISGWIFGSISLIAIGIGSFIGFYLAESNSAKGEGYGRVLLISICVSVVSLMFRKNLAVIPIDGMLFSASLLLGLFVAKRDV